MIGTTNKFWGEIYDQNIKTMTGICYRYTGDRQLAEDLAHDAFVIAYQKIGTYEGKGPLPAWIRRIVVNVCLQHFRVKSKEKYVSALLSKVADTMDNDAGIGDKKFEFYHEELLAAINLLPEHHKLVFNLYVIDKFSHAQIGKELGISEGTSKSHLARARKKIKQVLVEKSTREKQKKDRLFFSYGILLMPWNIEKLYYSRFRNFKIPNLKKASFGFPATDAVRVPMFKPSFLGKNLYPSIAVSLTGIVLLISTVMKRPYAGSQNQIATEQLQIRRMNKQIKIYLK